MAWIKKFNDFKLFQPTEEEAAEAKAGPEGQLRDKSNIVITSQELRELLLPIFEKHNLMDFDVVDAETGERVKDFGVKFLYTEYEGKMLLDISHFGDYGVTHKYKVLYKGEPVTEMRELRSGRLIKDSIVEMDASMPQLLQFDIK